MVTVKDILQFVQTLAPVHMKEDWDNVGLNCGHPDREVDTVFIALDPFYPVCQEAQQASAQLLLTHHALIWEPGFITDETPWGRTALYLIENGIAHINAHTNLDCVPGGVNDVLAETLGLQDIQVIDPKGADEAGRPWGLLRCGTLPVQPMEQFLSHVKTTLGCKGIKYMSCGKPVRKVAVGGGSCAGAMGLAVAAGCDTFVTADVKYNHYFDAQELGINLIDAGHFHTENPICAVLAQKLKAAFPQIQVKLSQTHADCANFFL